MKLQIQLLKSYEGKVTFDEKRLEMTVEPHFADLSAKTLMYITVAGDSGRSRRWTLTVSGRSGRLTANELGEVIPHFDKLGPNDALDAQEGEES